MKKKQNIFENLIEKDKKIDEILKNNKDLQESNKNLQILIETVIKQNDEFKNKNNDLEIKEVLNKNTEKIVNNTNTQNITNNINFTPYKINPFDKEKFDKLNKKEILKIMTDTDNNGTFCFNKLIKLIHFNDKIPENHPRFIMCMMK